MAAHFDDDDDNLWEFGELNVDLSYSHQGAVPNR